MEERPMKGPDDGTEPGTDPSYYFPEPLRFVRAELNYCSGCGSAVSPKREDVHRGICPAWRAHEALRILDEVGMPASEFVDRLRGPDGEPVDVPEGNLGDAPRPIGRIGFAPEEGTKAEISHATVLQKALETVEKNLGSIDEREQIALRDATDVLRVLTL